MFSNLSQGSSVHIISTRDGVKYDVCPIEELKPSFPTYNNFSAMGPMLDIAVTIDGRRREFSGITASSSVSTSSDYIITDSKDAAIKQLELLLQNSENTISETNIEKHKNIITNCKDILKKVNPTFAKEAAVDSALAALTQRVDSMQSEFGDIKGDMKQVLSILTNGNRYNINTMIVLSFKTKRDKEHLLKKAKEMEAYASELVDCLEEAKHGGYDEEYDEDEYSERGYRGGSSSTSMRGRYGYRR